MLVTYLTEQFSWFQNLDFFIRIIVACICGAAIGFERSKRFKEAGIRTHIIVCCAAALMMIISKYAFVDMAGGTGDLYVNGVFKGTHDTDPARIAAQVVSGISFLGAGVIFKNGNTVKGLTTAAGLWATAGIGLAIGSGMYAIGLFTTLVICIIQIIMHKLRVGTDAIVTSRLKLTVKNNEKFRESFNSKLAEWDARVLEMNMLQQPENFVTYDVTIRVRRTITLEEINEYIASQDEVREFSFTPVL